MQGLSVLVQVTNDYNDCMSTVEFGDNHIFSSSYILSTPLSQSSKGLMPYTSRGVVNNTLSIIESPSIDALCIFVFHVSLHPQLLIWGNGLFN